MNFNQAAAFGHEQTVVIGGLAYRGYLREFNVTASVDGLTRARATFDLWGEGTPIAETTQREIEQAVPPIDRGARTIEL